MEHAILHLIYSRFWTKMMRDIGLITNDEPVRKLFTQGMVIRERREDVEVARATWCRADEVADKHGADTARLFALFAAPPETDVDWTDAGVEGIYRFLGRVYRFATRNMRRRRRATARPMRRCCASCIRRCARSPNDFDSRWHFNTSIAAMMELVNEMYAGRGAHLGGGDGADDRDSDVHAGAVRAVSGAGTVGRAGAARVRCSSSPGRPSIRLARETEVEIPVQINGKVRARLTCRRDWTRHRLTSLASAR